MTAKIKHKPIWCDHCNVMLSVASVRSCIRPTCKSKDLLPDAKRVWK
jgi:hypothetical protein